MPDSAGSETKTAAILALNQASPSAGSFRERVPRQSGRTALRSRLCLPIASSFNLRDLGVSYRSAWLRYTRRKDIVKANRPAHAPLPYP